METMTAEELAILDVLHMIEKLPADERLTNAQRKLQEARQLVADFVDGIELKKKEDETD
jgi:hypothetical protein